LGLQRDINRLCLLIRAKSIRFYRYGSIVFYRRGGVDERAVHIDGWRGNIAKHYRYWEQWLSV
jgi:hypothetical protein